MTSLLHLVFSGERSSELKITNRNRVTPASAAVAHDSTARRRLQADVRLSQAAVVKDWVPWRSERALGVSPVLLVLAK